MIQILKIEIDVPIAKIIKNRKEKTSKVCIVERQ
jgi:hypothetical protein